ncbi:unnamed protein product [Rotaria magnacalcarata]|uniref:Uncharacterized protein n=1 Tax=Rotaria magnacalcarata TaxID=392030 RepID=A0A816TYR2_9BILA|nr:unnamed protein product [Rotaria magnacalcarata]CAF2212840.1 unnamed protein product [Rotaria magnacalcarata]CAF3935876.1 unnamed protein product [Rotaria magnacalcarata]CAF4184852.1 unnamed protein product [Rotaria magnacalcarata]
MEREQKEDEGESSERAINIGTVLYLGTNHSTVRVITGGCDARNGAYLYRLRPFMIISLDQNEVIVKQIENFLEHASKTHGAIRGLYELIRGEQTHWSKVQNNIGNLHASIQKTPK